LETLSYEHKCTCMLHMHMLHMHMLNRRVVPSLWPSLYLYGPRYGMYLMLPLTHCSFHPRNCTAGVFRRRPPPSGCLQRLDEKAAMIPC